MRLIPGYGLPFDGTISRSDRIEAIGKIVPQHIIRLCKANAADADGEEALLALIRAKKIKLSTAAGTTYGESLISELIKYYCDSLEGRGDSYLLTELLNDAQVAPLITSQEWVKLMGKSIDDAQAGLFHVVIEHYKKNNQQEIGILLSNALGRLLFKMSSEKKASYSKDRMMEKILNEIERLGKGAWDAILSNCDWPAKLSSEEKKDFIVNHIELSTTTAKNIVQSLGRLFA